MTVDFRAVQADYDAGSGIDLDGRRFVLHQFHFHAPSEHTVEGRSFPAEIHFVHDSPAGEVVVIGALVDAGRRNDALAPVLDNLPTTVDLPRAVIDEWVSAAAILGAVGESIRYDGSLTTPPCTEGVRWIVLAEPLQLDEAQIDQIRAVVHENNRPVQPARGRPIASVHALDQPVTSIDWSPQFTRRRRIDVLVCWRLDRRGRNLRHLITLLDELQALGVAFVSLAEGIDATTPAGQAADAHPRGDRRVRAGQDR